MENGMDYIEDYFGKEATTEEIRQFEQYILEDPAFADEVAFYLGARQVARDLGEEEKKQRFLDLYHQAPSSRPLRTIGRAGWGAIAAAVFGALLFSWYLYQKPAAPGKLANRYIEQHWQTLGVSMSSREDSIQTGLHLYNEGKWQEALQQFETIIRSGNPGPAVKKYAGIVTLRLKDYDKALVYFKQLANYHLYANPGLFYQAVTLLERNQSGDRENAKQILQQIVKNDLEEKETAQEWLRKL
ncbi:MAG TPA: tetratricopeptide repeat protein [Puia sp.]